MITTLILKRANSVLPESCRITLLSPSTFAYSGLRQVPTNRKITCLDLSYMSFHYQACGRILIYLHKSSSSTPSFLHSPPHDSFIRIPPLQLLQPQLLSYHLVHLQPIPPQLLALPSIIPPFAFTSVHTLSDYRARSQHAAEAIVRFHKLCSTLFANHCDASEALLHVSLWDSSRVTDHNTVF